MMENLIERNLTMMKAAADEEGFLYGVKEDTLHLFLSSGAEAFTSKEGVFPAYISMRIKAQEDGLEMCGLVPFRFVGTDEGFEDRLLEVIAKENYGNIRGGLFYDPQTGKVGFKLFVPVSKSGAGVTGHGLMASLELCRSMLSRGCAQILRHAKPQPEAVKADGSNEFLQELEALLKSGRLHDGSEGEEKKRLS